MTIRRLPSKPSDPATAKWLWLPLLVLVLVLFLALRDVRKANRGALVEAESLQRETAALQQKLHASVRAAPPTVPVATVPARSSETKQAPKPAGLASYSDTNALSDPDFGAPVVRRHRRYAMANYRGAIDALQLEPAEKDRLKQLIIERWNASEDVADIRQREGKAWPESGEKLRAEVLAAADQEIRALLGDEGFANLESVYQEQSTKSMNWGLFTAAWDAGVPLSDDQQTRVTRAMLQVRTQFSPPETANEIDPASGLTRADLALLRSAASFLSPEQVAVMFADVTGTAEYRAAVREAEQRKRSEAMGRSPR